MFFRNVNIKLNCCFRNFALSKMAKSRYEYVKNFELDDRILPNCWIVVRIDGKSFHKFCKLHDFEKPNDECGLNLMNYAAISVMKEFSDIILSYGQSDEYSFIFHKSSQLYNRRSSKIMTYVNSLFTSSYVFNWSKFFPTKAIKYPPSFDSRVILYPTDENLRDYLSWRQADVHINNLYNTAFWNLVLKDNKTNIEAEELLRGTFSADKNELLFTKFGLNYNTISPMFRKGTILLRKKIKIPTKDLTKTVIAPIYDDLIQDKFWIQHSELLGKKNKDIYDLNHIVQMDENGTIIIPELILMQIEE